MRGLVLMVMCVMVLPGLGCRSVSGSGPNMIAMYDKSGGIAGLDQRLIVRSDGSLVLHDRRSGERWEYLIDPEILEPLETTLRSREFRGAKRLYPGDPGGADLMTYTVEADTGGRRHTVTTMDSASHPAVVQRAIDELERLAQIVRERGRQL